MRVGRTGDVYSVTFSADGPASVAAAAGAARAGTRPLDSAATPATFTPTRRLSTADTARGAHQLVEELLAATGESASGLEPARALLTNQPDGIMSADQAGSTPETSPSPAPVPTVSVQVAASGGADLVCEATQACGGAVPISIGGKATSPGSPSATAAPPPPRGPAIPDTPTPCAAPARPRPVPFREKSKCPRRAPARTRPTGGPELSELARATHAIGRRHPWLVQLIGTRPRTGPNGLHYTERMLAAVGGVGLDISTMAESVNAVLAFVCGYSWIEPGRSRAANGHGRQDARYLTEVVAGSGHPNLTRLFTEAANLTSGNAFSSELTCLLDGIERRIAATQRVAAY